MPCPTFCEPCYFHFLLKCSEAGLAQEHKAYDTTHCETEAQADKACTVSDATWAAAKATLTHTLQSWHLDEQAASSGQGSGFLMLYCV